ncbi:MAG TPA: MobA/MobL family protein [Candidatus Tectomicrobia bacterium]
MAIFVVGAAYISKGSSGGAAVGFARYLARTDQGYATQHRRYLERDGHDGAKDLVASGSEHLPSWAKDTEHFWMMADRYEFKRGVIARTYEFALPRELSPEGRLALAHDIRATFFAQYPHTWAVHCPEVHTVEGSGKEQPHMHVMFSPRREDVPSERTPEEWFRLAAPKHKDPRSGGIKKDAFWDQKKALQGVRHETAILINAALEREGHAVAVSHHSLRAQGHDRPPERDLARTDVVLLKKYGWEIPAHLSPAKQEQLRGVQDRWRENMAVREIVSRDYRGWENDMNVIAWHDKKEREGIRDLSREAVVDHVRDRFWAHDHSAVREVERASSIDRTIQRAYARAGRERPDPTVHMRTQEQERQPEPERDLDRVWERPLIGNRNSGIYHTPEHKNYGEVHPQNQERFWTERAAIEAGYRRAMNDHYWPGSGQAREEAEEWTHTESWIRLKRHQQARMAGQTRTDDMQHGAHVELDAMEQSR